MSKLKNLLLALIACVMLLGFAAAVPSGSVTMEAHNSYLNEAPADADDEYAFLFD